MPKSRAQKEIAHQMVVKQITGSEKQAAAFLADRPSPLNPDRPGGISNLMVLGGGIMDSMMGKKGQADIPGGGFNNQEPLGFVGKPKPQQY